MMSEDIFDQPSSLMPVPQSDTDMDDEDDGIADESALPPSNSASNDAVVLSVPGDLKYPPHMLISDRAQLRQWLSSGGLRLIQHNGDSSHMSDWMMLENFQRGNPPLPMEEVKKLRSQVTQAFLLNSAKTKREFGSEFMTAEKWLTANFSVEEEQLIIGSTDNQIVGPQTKNLIEAPEKSFKTTAMLRMLLGASVGETVFPELPFPHPVFVVYIHGELSKQEIKQRTISAAQGLPGRPFNNFCQGRKSQGHLIRPEGQKIIRAQVAAQLKNAPSDMHRVLVLDPWQSFITGHDENSFEDVSTAMEFIDNLIEDFKLTVFIPIHQGKDRTRGPRGSSALAGWRDTSFRLEPQHGKQAIKVTVEPRWGAPPDPFILTFKDGTVWPDDAFTPQVTSIREYLKQHDGHASKEEIGRLLKLGGGSLKKALQRAEHAGAITLKGDEVHLAPDDH